MKFQFLYENLKLKTQAKCGKLFSAECLFEMAKRLKHYWNVIAHTKVTVLWCIARQGSSRQFTNSQSFSRSTLTDAEFAFGIYDCDGSGKIDAFDIPDVLRSLNTNPTLELCEKMGATKKRGEKKLTVEEFLPIYGQVKNQKDQGSYEDFMECLKLYDKEENGTMLGAELEHTLKALGKLSFVHDYVILLIHPINQSIR